MTGRISLKLLSCVLAVGSAGCASFYEIPIETPIAAKLDVSAFQRVFIAGFLSGGTDDVDGNLETVRLLRSQLRMKSNLRVIDADVLPLMDVAGRPGPKARRRPSAPAREATPSQPSDQERERPAALRAHLRRRRLLEAHRRGISEPADRHRHRAVHAALAVGHGAARARGHRPARPPPRRAGARIHGAQGLHPAGEVHLHRRPLRRADLLRGAARRAALQPERQHAGAVVLFRADGRDHPAFPEHAQHAAGPRLHGSSSSSWL